jgi:hypothetical protein
MVLSIHDPGEPYETVRQSNHLFDIIWDERLKRAHASKNLYFALASYIDQNSNCSPSRAVLAMRLHCAPNAISAALGPLKETGWVVETQYDTPGGHRIRTVYHLPRLGKPLAQPFVGWVSHLPNLGKPLAQHENGSDEIVMLASLEVTGPQPVTSTPEGTEVPPVPSPEEPVLVTPEVPKVPTPSLPILGKGGVGGKPSFSAPPPEAEPTSIQQGPPPLEPLSPKAHAFMEAHRAAFALRRPLSLNPALRIELEQAVEDLGLDRLLVTLNEWAVLNDVRPIIKIIRGCRTSREGPEKRAMDAKRAVLAVPKPGQNKRSGSRQISRQATSSEEYAAQAIENGMITIDDNDIRSMRPAVEAILRARGSL